MFVESVVIGESAGITLESGVSSWVTYLMNLYVPKQSAVIDGEAVMDGQVTHLL